MTGSGLTENENGISYILKKGFEVLMWLWSVVWNVDPFVVYGQSQELFSHLRDQCVKSVLI